MKLIQFIKKLFGKDEKKFAPPMPANEKPKRTRKPRATGIKAPKKAK